MTTDHTHKKNDQTYLITKLKMKITWFGMEPQINSLSIVSDNVLSTRILVVATTHKFLHTEVNAENMTFESLQLLHVFEFLEDTKPTCNFTDFNSFF